MKSKKTTIGQYIYSEDGGSYQEHDPIETKMIKYRLGVVVYDFNELESTLEEVICDLIHDREHDTGMMYISDLSYSQKITLLNKLVLRVLKCFNDEELLSDIKYIAAELRVVGEFRNSCVHGYRHSRDDEGYLRVKAKYKDAVEIFKKRIGIKELDEGIDHIYGLDIELSKLTHKVRNVMNKI